MVLGLAVASIRHIAVGCTAHYRCPIEEQLMSFLAEAPQKSIQRNQKFFPDRRIYTYNIIQVGRYYYQIQPKSTNVLILHLTITS